MRGESCWLISGVGMQRATSRRSTPTSRAPQTQQTSRWEAGDHNNGWWHASDASGGQCACHLCQLMVSTQLWSHEHKPFLFVFLTFVVESQHQFYLERIDWYVATSIYIDVIFFSLFSMQLPMWSLRITSRIVGCSEHWGW